MYGLPLQSADLHVNSYIKQQRYRFVNSVEGCKMFRIDAGILVLQFLEQNFSRVLFPVRLPARKIHAGKASSGRAF